jgi:hypothetical protein
MGFDKEKLLERKELLRGDYDRALALLNALDGAMQECDYWLRQIEDGEKVTDGG